MNVLWVVEPCNVVEIDRRFRGYYCLHPDDNVSDTCSNFLIILTFKSLLALHMCKCNKDY